MLGRVILQFLKAKRVLKSLVSLESKFQEKSWAPKHHHELCLCLFLVTLREPLGTESLGGAQDCPAETGTGCEVPGADLSAPTASDW